MEIEANQGPILAPAEVQGATNRKVMKDTPPFGSAATKYNNHNLRIK